LRDLVKATILERVPGADPDLVEVIEDVQLGDRERGQAVDPDRAADEHGVVPATPSGPTGRGAELVPLLLQQRPDLIGQLGGKRPAADARGIGLADPESAVDGGGPDPGGACTGAAALDEVTYG